MNNGYFGAEIWEDYYCADCGSAIVELHCRHADIKPYSEWDWWVYCSNPICENHIGEGLFQNIIEWAKENKEDK